MLAGEVPVFTGSKDPVRIWRWSVLLGLSLTALLSVMACAGPDRASSEPRIFFCDDLRVHSVRPDGTGLYEFPRKISNCPWPVKKGPGIWRVLCGS